MARSVAVVVVAHPDDESFGLGGVIASLVAEGCEVVVVSATRGERGGDPDVREAELRAACRELGVAEVVLLGFEDSDMEGEPAPGTLCAAPEDDVVAAVAAELAARRPAVVVTMDPTGGDGHRDHARIAAATTRAVDEAAAGTPLYHWCLDRELLQAWQRLLDPDAAHASVESSTLGRPAGEITTVLEVSAHLAVRQRAIAAHASQTPPFAVMPAELAARFLERDVLVRARPVPAPGLAERSLNYVTDDAGAT